MPNIEPSWSAVRNSWKYGDDLSLRSASYCSRVIGGFGNCLKAISVETAVLAATGPLSTSPERLACALPLIVTKSLLLIGVTIIEGLSARAGLAAKNKPLIIIA